MLGYIRKFIDEKRETEARIAFRNKMEIIDRMEAYYIAVFGGNFFNNLVYTMDSQNLTKLYNKTKLGRSINEYDSNRL